VTADKARARADAPILIAGAGIAGLSAALSLARLGHAIRLIEQRSDPNETGAGLQISPNASHILDRLGVGRAIASVATRPDRLIVRRAATGERIGGMPMNEGAAGGAPFLSVMRQDLHAALLAAVKATPGIALETGTGLASVDHAAHPLVIGADGLWSAARAMAGDPSPPVYSGLEACRAVVDSAAVPPALLSPDINLWLGSGHHCVHYPVEGGRRTNVVFVRKGTGLVKGWHVPRPAAALGDVMARVAPELAQLLSAADGWQLWSLCDRPAGPMPPSPHIALVGDAAHPMLPFFAQGASLAIEDGAVLASLLPPPGALAADAVASALARYRMAREPRTGRAVKTAQGNARTYHLAAPASLARDMLMRALGPSGMRRRYGWLYEWRLAEAASPLRQRVHS
jgi:salicylate hydroxylase